MRFTVRFMRISCRVSVVLGDKAVDTSIYGVGSRFIFSKLPAFDCEKKCLSKNM